MTGLSAAERLLQGLGVTDPKEIDLEAIAYHQGATVKVCQLDGCEARIIGFGNRAVIRVSDGVSRRRRRFSIAHELGHWCHHRGLPLICRPEDIGGSGGRATIRERTANTFAADLILPAYLLQPIARQYKRLDFNVVREIADLFDASRSATAIRLIERRHSPALLICHNMQGRAWFKRSLDVPDHWFPAEQLDPESYAFDLLFGHGAEQSFARTIGADAWFDRSGADRYEVQEHSIRVSDKEILTLVTITDDRMLDCGS